MKEFNITCTIKEVTESELEEKDLKLVQEAKEATKRSYAPYSQFNVGAAVELEDGSIVSGTNQENAAYPSGLCAERTTLFYANSRYPNLAVNTLAIAVNYKNKFTAVPTAPCGACRQVILETEKRYNKKIKIILYGSEKIYIVNGIEDILPLTFGADDLNAE